MSTPEELRYLDLTVISYPRALELTSPMIEAGLVFSQAYLEQYLIYLSNLGPRVAHQLEVYTNLARNWLQILSPQISDGAETFIHSDKVSHHKQIAQRMELENAVLLTGKLEGTWGHMAAIDYLALHAPVILGIEPWGPWWRNQGTEGRRNPLLPDGVRVSLWATHPQVAAVFLVPYQTGLDGKNIDEFYRNLFEETGADFACATEGDPHLAEKLSRGKLPEGHDWRIIPKFPFPSTTESVRIR